MTYVCMLAAWNAVENLSSCPTGIITFSLSSAFSPSMERRVLRSYMYMCYSFPLNHTTYMLSTFSYTVLLVDHVDPRNGINMPP